MKHARWPIVIGLLLLLAGCGLRAQSVKLIPDDTKTDAVRDLDRGVLMVTDGKYQQAISVLFPLVRRFEALDDRADAAAATFWTGYCHEKLGEWADAESFYRLTIKDYPGTPAARQAGDRIALHSSTPAN